MDSTRVVSALGALAHEARLAAYRVLVEAGPDGLSAGVLSGLLAISPSSLSFHLQALLHAGLVSQRRLGRQLIYALVPGAVNGLVAYLTENCCGRASGVSSCVPGRAPAVHPARKEVAS